MYAIANDKEIKLGIPTDNTELLKPAIRIYGLTTGKKNNGHRTEDNFNCY